MSKYGQIWRNEVNKVHCSYFEINLVHLGEDYTLILKMVIPSSPKVVYQEKRSISTENKMILVHYTSAKVTNIKKQPIRPQTGILP